jgi:hypothetical protein
MIHVLTQKAAGRHRKWIPMREPKSAAIPFDFASQRMLVVDRHPNGKLNSHAFEDALRKRVRVLTERRAESHYA